MLVVRRSRKINMGYNGGKRQKGQIMGIKVTEENVKKGERYLDIGTNVLLKITAAAAIRKMLPKTDSKVLNMIFNVGSAILGDVSIEKFRPEIEARTKEYRENIEDLAGGYKEESDEKTE